ncbi:MAG: VWA domain-containing protein [Bdellovibrionales bacterium]|nr:VWA domain-containing protein [Ramlibacter sp.]
MSHRSRLVRPGRGSLRWSNPLQSSLRHSPESPVSAGDGSARGAIAWLPTLLAKGPQVLQSAHLRYTERRVKPARLHLIVLDTSGSMRQRGRLALAKGHAAWLIEQAARAGDHVALLCFGGQGVELRLAPGRARAAGSAKVRPLGGGGGTPLAHALTQVDQVLRRAQHRDGAFESWVWLLTDGRTTEQPVAPCSAAQIVIVDFDDPAHPIGRCAAWALRWGADYRSASWPV